jgi:hypothetical protein
MLSNLPADMDTLFAEEAFTQANSEDMREGAGVTIANTPKLATALRARVYSSWSRPRRSRPSRRNA